MVEGIGTRDGDRTIDWGHTSDDYSTYRPGHPESTWRRLEALDVGRPGQRVLDLGTGTGNLARRFAAMGCRVTAVDVAAEQVEAGRRLAAEQGLSIEWLVARAEETGLPDSSFDLVTASQCFLYFDAARMVPELLRLLAPGGRVMTCHLSWLPRLDPVARASEELVLRHNPDWSAADWPGIVPAQPKWSLEHFELVAMFRYDEPLPFTRESWRGRIRACRGVGATMSPADVEAFDAAHARLLEQLAPPSFTVLHRIDAHVLSPRPRSASASRAPA